MILSAFVFHKTVSG